MAQGDHGPGWANKQCVRTHESNTAFTVTIPSTQVCPKEVLELRWTGSHLTNFIHYQFCIKQIDRQTVGQDPYFSLLGYRTLEQLHKTQQFIYQILNPQSCHTTSNSHSLREGTQEQSENPLMAQTSACMLSPCRSDSATQKKWPTAQ